ncbi:MAG: hypothetical protein CSYNP_02230 [Syntrophus sp. SKADARSKE-3]|nr:hypothetical protein [Syntrophus sp. SKADARSKE-3]
MATILKEAVLPLGRPLYIPKEGNMTIDDLLIETNGAYKVYDKPDYFVVKNDECCRSIAVTVSRKD